MGSVIGDLIPSPVGRTLLLYARARTKSSLFRYQVYENTDAQLSGLNAVCMMRSADKRRSCSLVGTVILFLNISTSGGGIPTFHIHSASCVHVLVHILVHCLFHNVRYSKRMTALVKDKRELTFVTLT